MAERNEMDPQCAYGLECNWPARHFEDGKTWCALHVPQERAVKHDGGKPRLSLVPADALAGLMEVIEYGARKYGDGNWAKGGMNWTRWYDAAGRHLLAWMRGEDIDPESGLPHVDHAVCSLMFLSAYQKRSVGKDDRR